MTATVAHPGGCWLAAALEMMRRAIRAAALTRRRAWRSILDVGVMWQQLQRHAATPETLHLLWLLLKPPAAATS